ncbi:hypothetical protein Tco_0841068 [Tanacetum coccineum]|uniref:Uncharacterized protein n=1 Tax=Tanacetum coccineum TaxID=301880 RepID=A0ABQ5AVD5_9ASTR
MERCINTSTCDRHFRVPNKSVCERTTDADLCQRSAWSEFSLDHLYKHAPRTKENSVIYARHYVTKIASFLSYYVDDKIKKCSEPIYCEYWTSKMLADELDEENTCLKKETRIPT